MVQFTTVDRNPTIIFKFHDGSEQTWQYHYGVEPEGWHERADLRKEVEE